MVDIILEKVYNKTMITDIVKILNKYNYAICGGFAVAFYSDNSRSISPEDVDVKMYFNSDMEKNKFFLDLKHGGFVVKTTHFVSGIEWVLIDDKHNTGMSVDIGIVTDRFNKWAIDNSTSTSGYKVYNKLALIADKLIVGRDKDIRDVIFLLYDMDKHNVQSVRNLVKADAIALESFNNIVNDLNDLGFETTIAMYQNDY